MLQVFILWKTFGKDKINVSTLSFVCIIEYHINKTNLSYNNHILGLHVCNITTFYSKLVDLIIEWIFFYKK